MILDDEFENRKILSKLPAWLVNQWVEIVVGAADFPDFDHFAKFMEGKAQIANHALCSGHATANLPISANKVSSSDTRVQSQAHVAVTR